MMLRTTQSQFSPRKTPKALAGIKALSRFVNFEYFFYRRNNCSGNDGTEQCNENVFLCIPNVSLRTQVRITLCLKKHIGHGPFDQFVERADRKRYFDR